MPDAPDRDARPDARAADPFGDPVALLYAPCHVVVDRDRFGEPTGLTISGADDVPLWYVDFDLDDRPGKTEWAYRVEWVRALSGWGRQSGSGHQPAAGDLRTAGAVTGEPDGPADGDHPPGRTAGVPGQAGASGGVPDAHTDAVLDADDAACEHEYRQRSFRHSHDHGHPPGTIGAVFHTHPPSGHLHSSTGYDHHPL